MKGNIQAIPIILVATISLAIAVMAGYTVLDTVQDNTTDQMINQESLKDGKTALTVFNFGIILVNAGFYIASIIFVYQIRTNPIYALPSLLFLAISVWLSAELANIYKILASTGPFQPVANQFGQMTQFMLNYPLFTTAFGFVVVIMLYGKTRSGQEVTV